MNKSGVGIFCLALLCFPLAACAEQAASTANLIANAGFEQGLKGWWVHPRNNPQSAVVQDGAHSGQSVLRVQVSSDNRFPDGTFAHYWDPVFCIEQTLRGLKPQTCYEMSLWARTTNAVCFLFGAHGPEWYSDYLPLNCPAWQRFAVKFRTDEHETSKKIFLRTFHLADEVLIDDIAITEVVSDGVTDLLLTGGLKQAELVAQLPDMIKAQRARLARVKSQAEAAGVVSNAYVRMGLFIAGRYLDRVQRPDIQKRQTDYWTWMQLREVAWVLDATETLVRQPLPDVPPIPYDLPKIERGVFVAGTPPAPVFYGGYMGIHNDEDIPSFAGMGVSSVVIERGPNALGADGDGRWALDPVRGHFEQAQRANLKADMLLSPHWFPDWARTQAPDMATDRHGGIDYIIDHPVARKAIEQWLRIASAGLKDKPALMSFNLANEPDYWHSGKDPFSKPLWTEFIKARHGSIGQLNSLYGTSYVRFEEVPVPGHEGQTTGARCAYFDWCHFNAQHFADWFRWMNGLVKAGAPAIYTQVKISGDLLEAGCLTGGIDAEEICRITDIAGCDVGTDERGHQPLYAYNWRKNEICNDLLRSFHRQPVANSENHTINDGDQRQVSPDFIRASLWQGALHGLGQTACWEFGDAKRGEDGGIKLRPADIFGAGRAWLDARRCAGVVAAVVRAPPHVALLYTRSSLYWQKDSYPRCVKAAYTALTFLGEPVTFVTERELAEGLAPPVQTILLPHATHVAAATVAALEKFAGHGGTLIALGEGNLGCDEYDRARSLPPALKMATLPASADEQVLFRQLAPLVRKFGGPLELRDTQTGAHVFGVEYRLVHEQGRAYLSALNQLQQEQTVKVAGTQSKDRCKDLLSGAAVDGGRLRLQPMVPVLLDLGASDGRD